MEENKNIEENGNSLVIEVQAEIERLFEENPAFDIKKLQEYLKRSGELNMVINKIIEEIQTQNPDISHDELVSTARLRVAEIVQQKEAEGLDQNKEENEERNQD